MAAQQVQVRAVGESWCSMPVIESAYKAPFYLRNKHLSTVLPSLFRTVNGVDYKRERITTPDNDFLDLDWIENGNNKVVIVLHGLEGNSERHYSLGIVKHFVANGWDAVAWNARSCSGEMNGQPRMYHHADIADLEITIERVLDKKNYEFIALVGVSMGGAIILNYLSKTLRTIPDQIKAAVAISAPVDVGDSARELEMKGNGFYLNRFLKKLKRKIEHKSKVFPDLINISNLEAIHSFSEFDDAYTAPLHGFVDANDFYRNASSKSHLKNISRPTLILTAKNDPFMPDSCYPFQEAKQSKYVYLEVPKHGGHVGFPINGIRDSWMEIRALEFVKNFI